MYKTTKEERLIEALLEIEGILNRGPMEQEEIRDALWAIKSVTRTVKSILHPLPEDEMTLSEPMDDNF